jgi:hypothetical protein
MYFLVRTGVADLYVTGNGISKVDISSSDFGSGQTTPRR